MTPPEAGLVRRRRASTTASMASDQQLRRLPSASVGQHQLMAESRSGQADAATMHSPMATNRSGR